jgi:hypothetical protein
LGVVNQQFDLIVKRKELAYGIDKGGRVAEGLSAKGRGRKVERQGLWGRSQKRVDELVSQTEKFEEISPLIIDY